MTWQPSKPNASESPSVFPPQQQGNNGRLETIVGADHQFNTNAASNDGYHKVTHYVTQSGAYGDNTPASVAGVGKSYTKTLATTGTGGASSEHLMYHQGTGGGGTNEACLSVWPVRAAATFNSSGTVALAFNVTSVTQNSQGIFTIAFTTAIPSTNYSVLFTCERGGNDLVSGQIVAGTRAVNQVQVIFYNDSSDPINPTIASVVVMGG